MEDEFECREKNFDKWSFQEVWTIKVLIQRRKSTFIQLNTLPRVHRGVQTQRFPKQLLKSK